MDKEAYILRISQANPTQLVVINFELILEFLTAAEGAIGTDEFLTTIQKAKNGLEQLIDALDLSVTVSHDFYEIYKYTYKRLSDISFTRDENVAKEVLAESKENMQTLLDGWRVAAESDAAASEAPVANEAPKVYTGLTYGKGGKAEEYIAEDTSRGYMA